MLKHLLYYDLENKLRKKRVKTFEKKANSLCYFTPIEKCILGLINILQAVIANREMSRMKEKICLVGII